MTETERVPLAGAGGNWFNAEKATRWEGDALGAPEEVALYWLIRKRHRLSSDLCDAASGLEY